MRTSTSGLSGFFFLRNLSDVFLAAGVLMIVALMVFRLPVGLIDALVGLNIAMGVGLLLVAIYIPKPVAFNSFPSVLLITTLFRLSLSVATTRLILIDADAGNIIDAFGHFVAGGNLVVGIVVFIIITVVQFIVIAKGAERVAEVAARFTLDAMPGKQMSIDSDLRSGLISQQEAKDKRNSLEQESQLNGALDGAMKFVKGDAIASIIIVIVNLVGGLAIGLLQRGMPIGEAMQVYSILTIGDGMVAQIPALLGAMAAGLVVTRTTGEIKDKHLGEAIGRQIGGQPRALLVTGLMSLLLAAVPGFPWVVFLGLSILLIAAAYFADPTIFASLLGLAGQQQTLASMEGELEISNSVLRVAQPLVIELGRELDYLASPEAQNQLKQLQYEIGDQLGVPFPDANYRINTSLSLQSYHISVFDVTAAIGSMKEDSLKTTNTSTDSSLVAVAGDHDWFLNIVESVLRKHAAEFLGTQEVSNLLDESGAQYPALVKEVLRVVAPQHVAEVMRNLVNEGIPIRNLRDIFEALVEWGEKEKDPHGLTEFVRIGLKRYITSTYVENNNLSAIIVSPDAEEVIRQSIRQTPAGPLMMMDPQQVKGFQENLYQLMQSPTADYSEQNNDMGEHTQQGTTEEHTQKKDREIKTDNEIKPKVILTTIDIRRHVKKLIESEFSELVVLSYQELMMPVNIIPLGNLDIQPLSIQ